MVAFARTTRRPKVQTADTHGLFSLFGSNVVLEMLCILQGGAFLGKSSSTFLSVPCFKDGLWCGVLDDIMPFVDVLGGNPSPVA